MGNYKEEDRARSQWERDIRDAFSKPITEAGRLALIDNVSEVLLKMRRIKG